MYRNHLNGLSTVAEKESIDSESILAYTSNMSFINYDKRKVLRLRYR